MLLVGPRQWFANIMAPFLKVIAFFLTKLLKQKLHFNTSLYENRNISLMKSLSSRNILYALKHEQALFWSVGTSKCWVQLIFILQIGPWSLAGGILALSYCTTPPVQSRSLASMWRQPALNQVMHFQCYCELALEIQNILLVSLLEFLGEFWTVLRMNEPDTMSKGVSFYCVLWYNLMAAGRNDL